MWSRTVGHLTREGPCFLPQTPTLHPKLHPPEPVFILHPPSTVSLHQGCSPQMDVQHGRPAAPVGRAPLLPGVWCAQEGPGERWMDIKAGLPPHPDLAQRKARGTQARSSESPWSDGRGSPPWGAPSLRRQTQPLSLGGSQ